MAEALSARRAAAALAALTAAAGLLALAACAAPHLKAGSAGKAVSLAKLPEAPRPTPTPAPSYPQNKPLNQGLPVQIRSRTLRYDQKTQETVFYGGVTATQDTTVLNAKELRSQSQGESAHASGGVLVRDEARRFRALAGEADYADSMRAASLSQGVRLVTVDPYGRPLTVTGKEGAFNDLSRWAQVDGGVKVDRGLLHATALTATVEDGGARLQLDGDVHAMMEYNRMQARTAVFDQKERSVDLEGDVRLRVVPDEVRSIAAAPWSVSSSATEGQ